MRHYITMYMCVSAGIEKYKGYVREVSTDFYDKTFII